MATKYSRYLYNVHPTALISSCDFVARVNAEIKLGLVPEEQSIIGLVIGHLGTESNPAIEILDCCEVKFTTKPSFAFSAEFIANKHHMLKKVDPDGEILGWFCFGEKLPDNAGEIHAQFQSATASLHESTTATSDDLTPRTGIAVVFHKIDLNNVNDLPVSVYKFDNAGVSLTLTPASAALALDAAEEIAMYVFFVAAGLVPMSPVFDIYCLSSGRQFQTLSRLMLRANHQS